MDNFEIVSCEEIKNIDENKNYRKLEFTSGQKLQLSGLAQNIPAFAVNNVLGNAYTVKFPEGVEGHLMNYTNGGLGTSIVGENGTIVDHASMYKITENVAIMNAFSVMSIASGQYYLLAINSQLSSLNQTIDKILEFLYSDKKSELISEVEFTKYAYENYSSIMSHNEQRTATIVNLQEAKKVAMKDIEFYLSDLSDTVNTKENVSDAIANKALQTKDCLELALQLYFMSNILEIYYSRNLDKSYIVWTEKSVTEYLNKCDKRILSNFSKLSACIENFKNTPIKKIDKIGLLDQINDIVNSLSTKTESEISNQFRNAIKYINSERIYYVDGNNNIYLRKA